LTPRLVDVPIRVPGPRDQCWVTSLTTLLGPVAREEISRELTGPAALGARMLSHFVEAGLRLSRADAVVFPAHLGFTTSLYAKGEAEQLCAKAAEFAEVYPGRAVVLRSLNRHHHAPILARGGTLWPVRVVWIIDDVARDWRPRRDVGRDLRWLETSDLERRRYAGPMLPDRLDQVLALYRRLYIERYSRHNPDYTPAELNARLEAGEIEILTLERGGEIVAFCAIHMRGGVLSAPMVGYDEGSGGLYRAVMTLPALEAEARGVALNLSAGAARFKRHRGARPHVEYLLIHDAHLPMWRRLAYRATGALLRALEPQLKKAATR